MWGEALLASVYLYNRTPHSSINYKTPYELKNKEKPNISNIKVWGSIAYYKNKGNKIKKLDSRANKGVLIGYGQNQYRIWDLELKRPLWSRDVKILENKFITTSNTSIDTSNEVEIDINDNNTNNDSVDFNINNDSIDFNINKDLIDSNTNNESIDSNTNNDLIDNNDNHDTSTNTSNTLDINDDLSLDELALVLLNNINSDEPKTYKQALESSNKLEWINAMNNEIKELEAQNTWTITRLPLDQKAFKR